MLCGVIVASLDESRYRDQLRDFVVARLKASGLMQYAYDGPLTDTTLMSDVRNKVIFIVGSSWSATAADRQWTRWALKRAAGGPEPWWMAYAPWEVQYEWYTGNGQEPDLKTWAEWTPYLPAPIVMAWRSALGDQPNADARDRFIAWRQVKAEAQWCITDTCQGLYDRPVRIFGPYGWPKSLPSGARYLDYAQRSNSAHDVMKFFHDTSLAFACSPAPCTMDKFKLLTNTLHVDYYRRGGGLGWNGPYKAIQAVNIGWVVQAGLEDRAGRLVWSRSMVDYYSTVYQYCAWFSGLATDPVESLQADMLCAGQRVLHYRAFGFTKALDTMLVGTRVRLRVRDAAGLPVPGAVFGPGTIIREGLSSSHNQQSWQHFSIELA
jgi:hypothetical protein